MRIIRKVKRLLTYLENPLYFVLKRRNIYLPIYEELNRKWLRLLEFSTIIDIGANAGQFASAARELFPKAVIHCFEPLPDGIRKLCDRWENDSHVHIHPFAVSDTDGEVVFYRSSFSQTSSLMPDADIMKSHKPWIVNEFDFKVASRRLDGFFTAGGDLNEKPILIKIDVEGAADKVIRGGSSYIKNADVVIIETEFAPLWSGQSLFKEIYEMLHDTGHIFLGVMDQQLHSVLNFPVQCNCIFVSKDIFDYLINKARLT